MATREILAGGWIFNRNLFGIEHEINFLRGQLIHLFFVFERLIKWLAVIIELNTHQRFLVEGVLVLLKFILFGGLLHIVDELDWFFKHPRILFGIFLYLVNLLLDILFDVADTGHFGIWFLQYWNLACFVVILLKPVFNQFLFIVTGFVPHELLQLLRSHSLVVQTGGYLFYFLSLFLVLKHIFILYLLR